LIAEYGEFHPSRTRSSRSKFAKNTSHRSQHNSQRSNCPIIRELENITKTSGGSRRFCFVIMFVRVALLCCFLNCLDPTEEVISFSFLFETCVWWLLIFLVNLSPTQLLPTEPTLRSIKKLVTVWHFSYR